MIYLNRQKGFSAVEILLIILVVGLIVLVGYVYYANQISEPAQAPAQSNQTTNDEVQDAPTIDSADDLDKANDTIDQTNPDSSNEDAQRLDEY